jgi:hypothetical protein
MRVRQYLRAWDWDSGVLWLRLSWDDSTGSRSMHAIIGSASEKAASADSSSSSLEVLLASSEPEHVVVA